MIFNRPTLPNQGNLVVVTQPSQLTGTLDSNAMYEIRGSIDMGSNSIIVPSGGLNIRGLGFGASELIADYNGFPNKSLFESPVEESGSLNLVGLEITVSIDPSSTEGGVFNLRDSTRFNAVEMDTVNFNNCDSLGELSGYRQGLEINTGRFGGTPTLTLGRNWNGGYRCTTSIVRNVSSNTILFSAGNSFLLKSRFLTDMNADIPIGASICDFSPSNIENDGDFQISNGDFTGLTDKSLYFPNMPVSSSKAFYRDNSGIVNTFVGGVWQVNAEVLTTITTQNVYEQLQGTLEFSDLVYFTGSNPNAFIYTSTKSLDVTITGNIKIDGPANDSIRLLVRIWRDSISSYEDGRSNIKQISNVLGGLDLAEFFIYDTASLNINDRIEIWARNESGTGNITMTLGSILSINRR